MKTIIDRISELVANKRLLDIGAIGDLSNPCPQFRIRAELAKEAFGIDINQFGIEKATKQGLNNLYYCDICSTFDVVNLKLRLGLFDVITATEVLEHVTCFSQFFNNINFLLKKDGCIFITTVNAFSVRFFTKKLAGELRVNPEHVCWFDEVTLVQLVERSGFKVKKVFHAVPPTGEELDCLGLEKVEDWMSKKVGVIAAFE